MPLDVLYEDDDLMAMNKPAGMVVHPSFRNTSGHASSTACCGGFATERICGQVWSAVSTRTHQASSAHRAVARRARPHSTRYTSRTGHEGVPRDRPRHAAASRGRDHAASRARPCRPPPHRRQRGWRAERDAVPGRRRLHGTYSLVHCELVTGRTHQIRVHLAARGVADRRRSRRTARPIRRSPGRRCTRGA